MQSKTMSIAEAAQACGMSRRWVYYKIKAGHLAPVPSVSPWRVTRDSLVELLEKGTAPGEGR